MISTPENIRITKKEQNSAEFLLYNSRTGEEYCIDKNMLEILVKVNELSPNNKMELCEIVSKLTVDSDEIVDYLLEENIWTYVEKKSENIIGESDYEYLLSTLTIELTDICSLHCIHCYGKFGNVTCKREYSLDDIKKLKPELDLLNVRSVVLTGGDVFLNKYFIDIAKYILQNGFKLTILCNGWHDVSILCKELKEYYYTIAFSIDGLEEKHDYIRGRKGSYAHVIKALKMTQKYPQITTKVNITVMKNNYDEINAVIKKINKAFPDTQVNTGLIIPVGDENIDISKHEFEHVYSSCELVFKKYVKENDRNVRCQGGISLCSLSADGNVYICPAARDNVFLIGNIYDRSLAEIWMKPAKNLEIIRTEKHQNYEKCISCIDKEKCKKIQDCRIYALKYTGACDKPSPVCCYIASKERKK